MHMRLHTGTAETADTIERQLSPDTAAAEEFSQSETATVTKESFDEGLDQVLSYMHQWWHWLFAAKPCHVRSRMVCAASCGCRALIPCVQAGLELLQQGVQSLVDAVERLVPDMGSIAIDAE